MAEDKQAQIVVYKTNLQNVFIEEYQILNRGGGLFETETEYLVRDSETNPQYNEEALGKVGFTRETTKVLSRKKMTPRTILEQAGQRLHESFVRRLLRM